MAVPDLIVSSLSAPGTAAPGDSISVSDTTRNQSSIGASTNTTTRFFLSTDSVLDAGDVSLGSRSVLGLAGGASSSGSTTLTIPTTITVGPYFILARADSDEAQLELDEANNVSARALTVNAPPDKDLVIEALSLSTGSVVAGASTTASYRVANRGTVAVSATYTDKLFLSVDATLEAGDVHLGTSHGHTADLPPNATHDHSQAVTIPAGTAPGSHYILVQADALGAVGESSEINNVAAIAVTVTAPPPSTKDLVIVGLTLSKATVTTGGSLTVSYSVKNQGTTTVTQTYTDRIYLSSDGALGTGDVLLGTSHGHPNDLIANATHGHSQSVTIPAGTAPGGYFILVRADALAAVSEADEANNVTAIGFTVTAPPPSGKDLVIEGLGLSSGSVAPGGSLTASYLVVNRGTITVTATYTDRLYLSADATLDASDVVLGTSHGHTSDLSANATHSHSQSIAVPAGTVPGSYFVLVQADALGAVSEVNETNNVTAVPLAVNAP
jgi:subtilase family serine protease